MPDALPSTAEFVASNASTEVTINAEKAVGELVLEGAEAAVASADPETLAEEQAEVSTEIKEDVAALPVETPEAAVAELAPQETHEQEPTAA